METTKDLEIAESRIVITEKDLTSLLTSRSLIKQYISAHLIEGINADYAILPGTQKKVLLKAGAQKLRMLFNLGCRVEIIDKIIDAQNNIALFTYRAEVYSLKTGTVIACCDGSCNSKEKKYREKSEWSTVNGKKVKNVVEASAMDNLNTIMKMAQKRAIVGATLEATGASEYFTQDLVDEDDVIIPEIETTRTEENLPICKCGQKMMVSIVNSQEYYCKNCRKKLPRN